MKLALLVIGDGRDYIHQTVPAALRHVLHPITTRLMIDDSGNPEWGVMLDERYPEFIIEHGGRRGMAGAVQAGFDLVLQHDPDFALWCEDDMLLTRDLPIAGAAQSLDVHPELAQMVFKREPWWGREVDLGDQLAAICEIASHHEERENHTAHNALFSLNPMLVPKRILERGWQAGNEAEMTEKLLADGFLFATWGKPGDEPFARHIGHLRGAGWKL